MATPPKLRALYRSFLRELPSRPLSEKSQTPLQQRIRQTIATDTKTPVDQAEQILQYIKAQRIYASLLERYNPGMNMDDEERIRLTAKRVGMELPVEFLPPDSTGTGGQDSGPKQE